MTGFGMSDISPDEFLTSAWLRGKEDPEAKAHLSPILPPEASPAFQRRTHHETLNNPELMPRVCWWMRGMIAGRSCGSALIYFFCSYVFFPLSCFFRLEGNCQRRYVVSALVC